MNKSFSIIALIVGVVLVGIGMYYFVTPAGSLPTLMPGYEIGSTTIHIKHGLAAILLALGLFAYTWFATGGKSST